MIKLFTVLIGLFLYTSITWAETYKVYIGNSAGSLSDVYTRKIFDRVEKITDDNFIIINRPGAEQMVAYQSMLEESKTNPNVIYSSGTSTQVASYFSQPELKLDPLKDTKSLILVTRVQYHLIVKQNSNINSIADIKGPVNIGSSNNTNNTLIRLSNFNSSVQTIPYKSDNEVILALLKDEIQIASAISLNPLIRTHKDSIKIISNFDNLNVTGATGYTVPNNFSEEKLNKLNQAINQVLQQPDIRAWFREFMGTFPVGGVPDQYTQVLQQFKRVIYDKSK